MNETELEQLFRNAARDAPDASFDEQDVLRGSRRVTARRRTALAGGSLVAAAVLVGGIGAGTGFFGSPGEPVAQAPAAPTQAPMALPQEPATPRSGPITLGDPKAGAGCGTPDSALAAALTEQLPEARSTQPTSADGSCPIGSRTAAVPVREGAVSGKVALLLSPSGARPAAAEGRAPHTEVVEVPTRSGRTLTVLSEPMGAPTAPFADRLDGIAADLAPRF